MCLLAKEVNTNLQQNYSIAYQAASSAFENQTEIQMLRSALPHRAYGYSVTLREAYDGDDALGEKLNRGTEQPLRQVIKPLKPSLGFRLLNNPKQQAKAFIQREIDISKNVQQALTNHYQFRGTDSQENGPTFVAAYFVEAFQDYLKYDVDEIKASYSGEAKDFANRINQYYMHLRVDTKMSLEGRQIKALVDNSMQLHKLLKK